MSAEEKTNPFIAKSIGEGDQKSRAKAQVAHDSAQKALALVEPEEWPRGVSGNPMQKITMTASELLPTGQYANVSVGPAQITAFIDTDRVLEDGESYFTQEEKSIMGRALNELAEIVGGDVVAVQRNLVMESMQNQL